MKIVPRVDHIYDDDWFVLKISSDKLKCAVY